MTHYVLFLVSWGGVPVDKVLESDIVVNKFKLKSCYSVHFQTNTLGKGMNPLNPSYGLNSIIAALLQGELWYLLHLRVSKHHN